MISKYFEYDNLIDVFNRKFIDAKSKGIDKKSGYSFNKKLSDYINDIQTNIADRSYKFSPYLEKLVIKDRFRVPRVLSIPTIRDRIVLHQLKEFLHSVYPDKVSRKSQQQIVRELHQEVNKNLDYNYIIRLDLKSYYDKIDRTILLNKLRNRIDDEYVLELIHDALKNVTVPKDYQKQNIDKYYRKIGVPQGLSISNILAQIYLIEFDAIIDTIDCCYARYVDDILIFCPSKNKYSIFSQVQYALKKLNLELNSAKTICSHLKEPVIYLGYKFQNKQIGIAERNVQKRINKIAAKFTWFNNGWEDKEKRPRYLRHSDEKFKNRFIVELNSLIAGYKKEGKLIGFVEYYKEVTDIAVFYMLDKIVDRFLKRANHFEGKKTKVKSFVRAYFEIKFSKDSGYYRDYNELKTYSRQKEFLNDIGAISANIEYNEKEISLIFDKYLEREYRYNNDILDGYY